MKTNKQIWIYPSILLGVILMLSSACKKDTVPSLSTTEVTEINQCRAISGGDITEEGGSTISYRGVCWSTEQAPTIDDNRTIDAIGKGSFKSIITNLTANTTYYLRAYATNASGTSYGNEIYFTTDLKQTGSVTDIDGNIYNTITIGNQEWMTENLKTTRYNNGDLIETTTPSTLDISDENTPKYQWAYDGDESNVETYGRLYTWHAATDIRGICPTGWFIPEQEGHFNNWNELTKYLAGKEDINREEIVGGMLKETGTTHWNSPNSRATDIIGFTALPAGNRFPTGEFSFLGGLANWWSYSQLLENGILTKAGFSAVNSNSSVLIMQTTDKNDGLSVRCVRSVN